MVRLPVLDAEGEQLGAGRVAIAEQFTERHAAEHVPQPFVDFGDRPLDWAIGVQRAAIAGRDAPAL